eukprot:2813255-Ditylum_brightwellii.AAC.2
MKTITVTRLQKCLFTTQMAQKKRGVPETNNYKEDKVTDDIQQSAQEDQNPPNKQIEDMMGKELKAAE